MLRKAYLPLLACTLVLLGLAPSFQQGATTSDVGLGLTTTRGIVGSMLGVVLTGIPAGDVVDIRWDGRIVLTVETGQATGFGTGSFKVPAATKGIHIVSARRGNTTIASNSFEVIPRIKLIPGMAGWGDQVNVSLRGYAPWTMVRIRWLRGTTWVEVARVSTSKTGSANVYVTVPSWTAVGFNSVRGDALTLTGGRAQTNAFRADRLIYVVDPIESMDRQSPPTATSSPTPTAPQESTLEPTATRSNTPNSEPPPAGTPVAEASG